ncbi:hypothetical protein SAMN04489867_1679 [Pedococcus dokdonensis]|uniref:Uncharacterized protein n=1 Tax=Pedococcus dokdonensis TaxID=443156 RepID=A0A1H0QPA7_9MICO|nr:hypothetical protein [Pedococcus dokdonensis]SDP19010.1 hypothetical protein SAMN04489867_1679 [Pedococcus dokdonensis]
MRTPRRRDRRNLIRRRAVYDAYLASHAWRDRRKAWYAAWLTQRGISPACLVCDREWSLRNGHLHHLTYLRIGDEDDRDLVPLCARHHRRLHEVMERSTHWRTLGREQASLRIITLLRRTHLNSNRSGTSAVTNS